MNHAVERFVTRAWYQRGVSLTWLLLPLSAVFYLAIMLRRLWYKVGILKSTRLPVPVIVIGNVTVGGTGKTPLTIAVVKHLSAQGKCPGVIMRGYGVELSGPVLVSGTDTADAVGDEALLIAQSTQVPVAIFPQRAEAARLLLEQGCDVLVADDGLQHYALARDIEIAVIDHQRGLGNGWLLPAGPLREPASRLQQVDLIVSNGGKGLNGMRLVPGELMAIGQLCAPLQPGSTVYAVCAIGNPERFADTLRQLGYQPILCSFADHHAYSLEDFTQLHDHPIIMTSKDAVKCRHLGLENAYELPVEAKLNTDDFWQALDDKLATIR